MKVCSEMTEVFALGQSASNSHPDAVCKAKNTQGLRDFQDKMAGVGWDVWILVHRVRMSSTETGSVLELPIGSADVLGKRLRHEHQKVSLSPN